MSHGRASLFVCHVVDYSCRGECYATEGRAPLSKLENLPREEIAISKRETQRGSGQEELIEGFRV